MFEKIAQFIFIEPKLLNTPTRYSFFKDQAVEADKEALAATLRIITASNKEAEMGTDSDATRFDLEAEIKSHPDSLFVKCFAIKADEMNDNGDWFGYTELKEATSTFVGVPVFTNHNNADAEAARGKVVHSWWDENRKGIMIIARVDAEAYPQLARGIKEEYIMGTSMGCQVKYSICSICHNKAETPDQYCEHIRERKTRQIEAKKQKCKYHEHGDEDECPLCQCKKGETNTYAVSDKAYEYNYGIKFIENSFVVNPACSDCGVTEVIDPQDFLAKVADIGQRLPKLLRIAAETDVMCSDQGCMKLAGQNEIQKLQDALDAITSVSQSMLAQKDQLDLEFLSDLVKVLADLQTVTDELTQQGYGRLQSPPETGQPEAEVPGQPPTPEMGDQPPTHSVAPGGGIKSGPAGQVGTITSPQATTRRINFDKLSSQLIRKEKELDLKTDLNFTREKLLRLELEIKPKKKLQLPFQI
jgi:hypothetical protein